MKFGKLFIRSTVLLVVCELTVVLGQSSPPAQQTPTPVVISPEVAEDRQITFRLLAPKAESVRFTGSDIPNVGQGKPMTKGDKGIWETLSGQSLRAPTATTLTSTAWL